MFVVHKVIRVTYAKHETGWQLVGMETSSGVRKLLSMPEFNPASTDPKRQHLRDLFEALQAAGLEALATKESNDGVRHEFVVRFSSSQPKPKKGSKPVLDEDRLAFQELQAESQGRLSTEEKSRSWLKLCQERLVSPRLVAVNKDFKKS